MIKEVKCILSDTIAGEGPKPLIKERGQTIKSWCSTWVHLLYSLGDF